MVRHLIERQHIPELRGFELVRAEVPLGKSRFDFLLRGNRHDLYLEVKSCTLFGNGLAMFPDAVTERGRRHFLELAALDGRRARGAVVFLVQTPNVRWFMPDYHTDLAFSRTFLDVRNRLMILPIAIRWKDDLSLASTVKSLEIPWDYLEKEVGDRGSYLLILNLKRAMRIRVGKLGTFTFKRGHYIYVGSAIRNLTARVARHRRLHKKLHWHVDYLRLKSEVVTTLPIRSSRRDECAVAEALSKLYRSGPPGFGSSDCGCAEHLFYVEDNPLSEPAFHRILQDFRMRPPR